MASAAGHNPRARILGGRAVRPGETGDGGSEMRLGTVAGAAALGALLAAGTAAAQQKIVVCGTGDSQEVLRQLGAAFEKANPGSTVEVPDSIGSTGGIEATAKGECDLGRVARPLKDKEKALDLTYSVFAFSPVVFVVDPAAGVDGLSRQQILDVFSGRATSWKALGGADLAIAVVNREAKDSSRGVLNERLESFRAILEPVGATAQKTPLAVQMLTSTSGAIGYLPQAVTKGTQLRVLKVDGVEPTPAAVVQEKYAYVAPFGLVWKGQLVGKAKAFSDFIRSEAGQKVLLDYGVVPAKML